MKVSSSVEVVVRFIHEVEVLWLINAHIVNGILPDLHLDLERKSCETREGCGSHGVNVHEVHGGVDVRLSDSVSPSGQAFVLIAKGI